MFSDRDAENGVGAAFPSDWRKTMAHAAASCQTEQTKAKVDYS